MSMGSLALGRDGASADRRGASVGADPPRRGGDAVHHSVGSGRSPCPNRSCPSTESQCLPGAGGVPSGHLNIGPSRRPAGSPLRNGCIATLKLVPGGAVLTELPSGAVF